ncbi:MAG: hypothetical protein WCV73_04230 [Patescibacteria group bacterium]
MSKIWPLFLPDQEQQLMISGAIALIGLAYYWLVVRRGYEKAYMLCPLCCRTKKFSPSGHYTCQDDGRSCNHNGNEDRRRM